MRKALEQEQIEQWQHKHRTNIHIDFLKQHLIQAATCTQDLFIFNKGDINTNMYKYN